MLRVSALCALCQRSSTLCSLESRSGTGRLLEGISSEGSHFLKQSLFCFRSESRNRNKPRSNLSFLRLNCSPLPSTRSDDGSTTRRKDGPSKLRKVTKLLYFRVSYVNKSDFLQDDMTDLQLCK